MVVRIRCRESCGAVLEKVVPGDLVPDLQVVRPIAGRPASKAVVAPGMALDTPGPGRRRVYDCSRCRAHHVFREDRVFDAVNAARRAGRTNVFADIDLGG